MQTFRRRLRPLSWLALVAMLALALAPTLSHALALARGGSAWAEVCTPQGARLVALGDVASEPAPGQAVSHLENCPFCALSSAGLAPPPAAPARLALPLAGNEAPPLFLHGPRTLHAWRSAQPRAPPSIS